MQDKIRSLLNKHCNTLKDQGCALDALLSHGGSGDTLELLSQAVFIAHDIKGGSGTMGFPAVSACAEKLEHFLGACIERNTAPDDAHFIEIRSLNHNLQKAIETLDPTQSSLWNRS